MSFVFLFSVKLLQNFQKNKKEKEKPIELTYSRKKTKNVSLITQQT